MRKIFTFCLGVMLVSTLSAQKPEGVIMKASVAPEIDGVVDDVWAEANVYNIDKKFQAELPTLGEPGETTWKALYTDEGFYLLLTVTDNSFWPSYLAGGNSYERDKPEVYFDINYILEDGLGCQGNVNKGHYQFDVAMDAEHIAGERGEVDSPKNGLPFIYSYAFMVDNPNYIAEYYFPFSMFTTNEGGPIDLTGQVGFDVTICESDEGDPVSPRKRAVWANTGVGGSANESWANMNDAGIITFDGAEAPVFVEEITLTVDGAITADNQTLQVMAEVLPEDAAVKTVKWVLTNKNGGAARATISNKGVITPKVDEELIIQAISSDGFVYSNEVEVSISGQIPTLGELSYIIDGFFDNADENGKVSSVWDTWANAMVTDGVLMFGPDEVLANPWDYHLQQITHIPFALKDLDYVISFKAWADAPRNMPLVLEDGYADDNQWDAYFTSTNEYYDGGKTYNIPLTTTPTVFKLHANFGPMKETTSQAFNWQVGKETPKMYLDSVYIISEADMALIPTAISQQRAMESFKVYPNPASDKLHIDLSTVNTTVAIYNSVGVKMDEAVVFGNHHMFDVSRYTKGLYFVKANGAVVKFIK